MSPYTNPRKVPSLLVIGVLVGTFFAISWMARNGIIFTGQAAPGDEPQHITISNISDTSFTVAYTTQDNVLGSVSYGNSEDPDTVILDTRDQESNTPTPRTTHFIKISNLTPETKYFFTVTSGSTLYKNGDTAYTVTTGSVVEKNDEVREITGSVITPDGSVPTEALVTLTVPDASPLTTLTKEDGTYTFALSSLRTLDGKAQKTVESTETMILTIAGTGGITTITAKGDMLSIPQVTLSETYDFTLGEPTASESAHLTFSEFPSVFTDESDVGEGPKILVPQTNEAFRDPQPSFSGKALPRSQVAITISSQTPVTTTVTADENGDWEYRPNTALTPGKQTITIKTDDQEGTERTISQPFTIFAEGTQFLDPSVSPVQPSTTTTATPTVSRTPTQQITPTVTTTPVTPTTSQAVSPTAALTTTPTSTPTLTMTPTSTLIPTATISRPPPPVSGSNDVLGIGLAAISAILVGSILFFMTKGSATL